MQGDTYFTEANAYTQWLTGFVSAYNSTLEPGPSQIAVDVNGIALWVKKYCEENPSENISSGAGAFIRYHRPEVLKTKKRK